MASTDTDNPKIFPLFFFFSQLLSLNLPCTHVIHLFFKIAILPTGFILVSYSDTLSNISCFSTCLSTYTPHNSNLLRKHTSQPSNYSTASTALMSSSPLLYQPWFPPWVPYLAPAPPISAPWNIIPTSFSLSDFYLLPHGTSKQLPAADF